MSAIKKTAGELAVSGGKPLFDKPLHVGRPNVGDRVSFLKRVGEIFDNRWFSNDGPMLKEFEGKVAAELGVKHCVAVCNATVALEIAMRAAGLKGEALVPAFTFIATAHALQWQEITPVFCDIDPATHNIDPARLEKMITPRTTGIVGVHCWGRPCDIDALTAIARKHKLTLLFDAAHAFGCSYKGKMIGNFGLAEVFSFHATKFFNTFEGGAITTNDDAFADKIRLMRNFGFSGYDNVIYIGTNGKMTEICAAMGLSSLENLHRILEINRRNYLCYKKHLAGIKGVKFIDYDLSGKCNCQYMAAEVDEAAAGISRDALLKILQAENVLARKYFFPGCHRMEPYRSLFPHAGLLLPDTEELARRILILPTGETIGEPEIAAICGVIRLAVENARIIAA
ncbi:MAG: DegT/DnrJ/EryC1/StrS family aminotransferase [Elusimicrobiales bacterium]